MPKCTINGQEVEVKEGATIIEAFKQVEHDIAHYCWHPGLSIAGVCRLCMVEIEGMPKLQIACNTAVRDGMVINNNSEKVKDTVRWGLDFHLINHPLDCPICDQAGECGLQDQYMKFGKYDPEMAERKVKKRKVVDLGPRVVLDSERCILCSRCVRFTDEVSKTNELGIFNRGDRSEIGTFADKPLDNPYSVNTVDICPVGALTSKDFRFRQRVWYLKEKQTVCPGCSTGCSVNMYYNEEGMWRVKPAYNPEVNGYWMCDYGRDVYKFVNSENRLKFGRVGQKDQWERKQGGAVAKEAASRLATVKTTSGAESIAVVLTGQYTNEEYQDFLQNMKNFGVTQFYHWFDDAEKRDEFDGLLIRGDKNPNTKGLEKALESVGGAKPWSQLESQLQAGDIKALVVAAPENQSVYPKFAENVKMFSQAENLIFMTSCSSEDLENVTTNTYQVPMKSYVEKAGTFTNYEGRQQQIQHITAIVKGALNLKEAGSLLVGEEVKVETVPAKAHLKTNYFVMQRGAL